MFRFKGKLEFLHNSFGGLNVVKQEDKSVPVDGLKLSKCKFLKAIVVTGRLIQLQVFKNHLDRYKIGKV